MKPFLTLVRSAVLLSFITVSVVVGPARPGQFVPEGLRKVVSVAWQVASPAAFAEVD